MQMHTDGDFRTASFVMQADSNPRGVSPARYAAGASGSYRRTRLTDAHRRTRIGHGRNKRRVGGPSRIGLIVGGVILAASLLVAMPSVFSETLTPDAQQYVSVTVAPGQTLWEIAAEHKAPRTDTRSVVYGIRTANGLTDATVHPGQVLRIPVRGR